MTRVTEPAEDRDRGLIRAMLLLGRYTIDISGLAYVSFAGQILENSDLALLVHLLRTGPSSPTAITEKTGVPRSTASRALTRLESFGLVSRKPDPTDGRRVLVAVTQRGRRRLGDFTGRLDDYFTTGQPLIKETFSLLGIDIPPSTEQNAPDMLSAAEGISRAGGALVAEINVRLTPLGVSEFADRHILLLLAESGMQRPSQIADELSFTPSGASGALNRLEAQNLILRRHDQISGDRRAVSIRLSPRGEQAVGIMTDVFTGHAEAIAAALAATWRT